MPFSSPGYFYAGIVVAQFNNNTSSPFSRFGLGDLHSYSHGRTTGMGGASLGSRNSRQINMVNPASYTSVDSLSFLFEFGITGRFSQFKNDLGRFSTDDVNFRYFAMSFPVSRRIATSFGLIPYSDVGYDIRVGTLFPAPEKWITTIMAKGPCQGHISGWLSNH